MVIHQPISLGCKATQLTGEHHTLSHPSAVLAEYYHNETWLKWVGIKTYNVEAKQFLCSTTHGSSAFLYPPETKPWTFKTKTITFQPSDLLLPRPVAGNGLVDGIGKYVENVGAFGPVRHKRQVVHQQGGTSEVTSSPQIINTTSLSTESSSNLYTGASANDTTPEVSTFGNMYLCGHPPKRFSPSFHGFPWETCLQYDTKWEASFRDTRHLCNTVYSLTEVNPEAFSIITYQSEVGPLDIMTHERYVKICLPLFRRFNQCDERQYLTVCLDDRVAFFHSSTCPEFSSNLFLAGFLMENNTECFLEFCEGRQRVVDGEIGGVKYRLTNTFNKSSSPSCGYMTKSLSNLSRKYNRTLYVTVNNQWPCCYPLYMVIWADLPEDHGLNGGWSYLPAACQAGEVLLVVLVGCVMTGGVAGNLVVVMVMLSGGHRFQESCLLRTSLAVADLLTATFVIVPSFVQHLMPFFSTPDYTVVPPDEELAFGKPENQTYRTHHVTHALLENTGFHVFQSVVFHMTSTESMLMLMILSVERFVITGRYLRYKDYFSYGRTVLAIAISWTTSVVNSLWFAANDDGGLSTQWDTSTKLPTGASGNVVGVLTVFYHGQFVFFISMGMSIVTFSTLSIKNFIKEQMFVAKEWRSLKMKASKRYSQDNRHVLTTMTLMLVLFLTSTLPLSTNIVFVSISYTFRHYQLFSYLAWWLFVASCAWNPWVYNFRSRQFKEDLTNFRERVLQRWQKKWSDTEEDVVPAASLPSSRVIVSSSE